MIWFAHKRVKIYVYSWDALLAYLRGMKDRLMHTLKISGV